jgi:hypothetical protein
MADKPPSQIRALSPEEIERIATKRAGSKLGWFIHAAAFTVVNLVIFAMSKYGFGDRSWSVIPFLGWGLGLTLHGVSVWVLGAGGGLRERMVQKERERLQRAQDGRNGP